VTLVFTTTGSWVSAIIRWFTGGIASHVAIGTDLHGVPVLLHADVGGVQLSHRGRFFGDFGSNAVVAEYRFVGDVAEARLARAVAHLGDRYDYAGLFGYAPVMVARWLGKKIRNPLASPRAMVCSEFVLLLDVGGDLVPAWQGLDPERTTPEDLLAICKESVAFCRVE
jgi:hypothetical protein